MITFFSKNIIIMNMKHDNCKRDMGILLISLLAEEGVSTLTMVLTLILTCLTTSWGGRFFYLTRPLLIREVLRKSSPVPFFTLKEGAPPLPRPPLLRRGLQPLHAVPLITPYGLQGTGAFISPRPISYATELRLSKRRGRGCRMGFIDHRLSQIDTD